MRSLLLFTLALPGVAAAGPCPTLASGALRANLCLEVGLTAAGVAVLLAAPDGTDPGFVSIEQCTARCERCARCKWISISHAHQQCDWFHACNTSKLNRRFGGETFKLRLVKQ